MPAYQKTQSAGSMREKVIFQRRTMISQNSMGAVVGGWNTLAGPVSARITPTTGNEVVLQDRVQPVYGYAITVRYSAALASLTPADRVVDTRTGRVFNITWLDNLDERKRFLVLSCELGTEVG